jgi:hypothetical protein
MKCTRFAMAAFSVLLGACGSSSDPFEAGPPTRDSSFENPDNVRIWVTATSAFALYAHVYEPVAVADGEKTFTDPTCPVTDDDGTTLTAEGDCTDGDGVEHVGKLTVKRSGDGNRAVTFEGYGTRQQGQNADTRDGEALVLRIDDTNHDFSLSLVHDAGLRETVDYEGRVTGGYDGRTVWSGSGTVVREGLLPPVGSAEVSTSAEVVDGDVCSGQPVSGNTSVTNASGDTVVVTYDGDVDCDDDQAASYALNGDPQGRITGISCSASPGGSGGGGTEGGLLATFALFAAGCVVRRRRR